MTSPFTKPSGLARPFDSWDALKILALLLMFIDHTGAFFYSEEQWLRAIGRSAAPIFMFLAGYAYSYRFKWSLFALALLMSISDFLLAGHVRIQNILFTILVSRMIFNWVDRRGGHIERPYEWYVGSLALFFTVFIAQYGCFGFLFAISGYLKRHSQYYSPNVPRNFLILSFITYACYTQGFTQFSIIDASIMIAVLGAVYYILSRFTVHDVHGVPPGLRRAGKLFSYYSGAIYALHLIALEWITGKPF